MEQHARWWPIVELSMPDWWDPEAVGKGASLSAALSQKAVRRPLLTAAVAEYMGEAVEDLAPALSAVDLLEIVTNRWGTFVRGRGFVPDHDPQINNDAASLFWLILLPISGMVAMVCVCRRPHPLGAASAPGSSYRYLANIC